MSYLSLLVLFLAVVTLTNIAGKTMHQIHEQPNSGLVDYQPPTADPAASFVSPPPPPHDTYSLDFFLGRGGDPTIGYPRNPPHITPARRTRPPP